MRFFIYFNERIREASDIFKRLSLRSVKNIKDADLIFVIGGDGSVLKFVPEALKYNKDILYYKCGEKSVLPGFKKLDKKMLLNIFSFKKKKFPLLRAVSGSNELYALNDIILRTGKVARLFKYSLRFDNRFLKISGDGVLFSTPIGSTAYNLSLSGPVLDSSLDAIIINPVASYDSEGRVFVISGKKIIKGKIEKSDFEVYLWADGQRFLILKENDIFKVSLDKSINFIVP